MKEFKDFSQERKGICVVARDDETFEMLFKRFKKKVNKSGIEKEVLTRMYYEKPSVKLRRKRAEAQKRLRREEAKFIKFAKKIEKKRDPKGGFKKDED